MSPVPGSWGLARIQASVGLEAFLKPQTPAAGEMPASQVTPGAAILAPTLNLSKVSFQAHRAAGRQYPCSCRETLGTTLPPSRSFQWLG